jgi:hypothetical protein
MRYVVGVVEALLALAFFATVVSQLIHGAYGLVNLAGDLVLVALGAWFLKVAIGNLKPKPELKQG